MEKQAGLSTARVDGDDGSSLPGSRRVVEIRNQKLASNGVIWKIVWNKSETVRRSVPVRRDCGDLQRQERLKEAVGEYSSHNSELTE